MMALLKVTALAVALTEAPTPVQVVAGAGAVAMVKPVGSVWVKFDCVRAKPFAFVKVRVSVDTVDGRTVAGEKAWVIVGAIGVGSIGVGQAVAAVPAVLGAVLDALFEVTVMLAVSVSLASSVIVSVKVPPDSGIIVNFDVFATDTTEMLPLVTAQKYEAIFLPQDAALPLASNTALLPAAITTGSATAAMGRCAACTAW